MEESPLISVITITFNAQDTIGATLESIHSQLFKDYEHIIIDGASSDDTITLARKFSNVRILSERDQGLYYAMNKGLDMARGKYLLFLNSGDTFHNSDTLGAYADRARRGDDIIYGDTVIVDNDRHIIGRRHLTAPPTLTFESFAKGMLVCHQAFMVKRELAPKYDVRYRYSSDYDWTVRCIKNADPRNCTNLQLITIDYLSDGLTDKNKFKSLRERYRIMSQHYGGVSTFFRHIEFIFRALRRRKL